MVSAIEAARKAARKAQEQLYDGVCTVIEYRKVKDEKTKLSGMEDVIVLEGQPCRISFSKVSQSIQGESSANISQSIKLFISPDVTIQPGSKITVTQNGVTTVYKSSGVPAVYATHQEIMLELYEERT